MRFWIMSDLHTEFEPFMPPDPLPLVDVAVVAGDFGIGGIVPALEWLERNFAPKMEVVIVAGNHDFYGTFHVDALREARDFASRLDRVHFLENASATIGGVTFIGATLWTDFGLAGNRQLSMFEASKAMSDYRRIEYSKRPFQRFNPLRTLRAHQISRSYFERTLEAAARPAVVVSHHAPSLRSVPDRYREHRLSPAYASDMDDVILRHQPRLWVHGHIHEPVDYKLGETRIVSDPVGYPSERKARRPPLVVEI